VNTSIGPVIEVAGPPGNASAVKVSCFINTINNRRPLILHSFKLKGQIHRTTAHREPEKRLNWRVKVF
ncbi:hypothetical protein VSWAT3_26816, partial [Vibrionales bacterium SWAT-3]